MIRLACQHHLIFIAKVVIDIINNDKTCFGIYNVVPNGNTSWYEFVNAYI